MYIQFILLFYSQCSFEIDLCQWSQLTTDDFDWTRMKGSTPTHNSGPTRDHSTGSSTGYYIYAEMSNPRRMGDKAQIGSQWFTSNQGCSITMYYHMYGPSIGKLTVYTRTQINGPMKEIWRQDTEVGNYFARTSIPIDQSSTAQQVSYAAIITY